MAKRTTSRTVLFLVVVEQTHDDAPSSSFPAAPEAQTQPSREPKPSLAKVEPEQVAAFPWKRAAR